MSKRHPSLPCNGYLNDTAFRAASSCCEGGVGTAPAVLVVLKRAPCTHRLSKKSSTILAWRFVIFVLDGSSFSITQGRSRSRDVAIGLCGICFVLVFGRGEPSYTSQRYSRSPVAHQTTEVFCNKTTLLLHTQDPTYVNPRLWVLKDSSEGLTVFYFHCVRCT